jgi:hypothetical protein
MSSLQGCGMIPPVSRSARSVARTYLGCGLCGVHDRAHSGRAVILAASVDTGREDTIRALCRGLLEWAKAQ